MRRLTFAAVCQSLSRLHIITCLSSLRSVSDSSTSRNDAGKPKDAVEKFRHRRIKGIVHDRGNYLVLYDGVGDAMTAVPLYDIWQLDESVDKYMLSNPRGKARLRTPAEGEGAPGECDDETCMTCSAGGMY